MKSKVVATILAFCLVVTVFIYVYVSHTNAISKTRPRTGFSITGTDVGNGASQNSKDANLNSQNLDSLDNGQNSNDANINSQNLDSLNKIEEDGYDEETSVKKNDANTDTDSSISQFNPLAMLAQTFHSQFNTFRTLHKDMDLYINKGFPKLGFWDGRAINAQRKALGYHVDKWTESGSLVARVTEHYKGKLSHGGSYIYGTVISADGVLSMCGYEDYFNGTYLLVCPMFSQCVQISVHTMQINYRHYQRIMEELKVPILQEQVCGDASFVPALKPTRYWQHQEQQQQQDMKEPVFQLVSSISTDNYVKEFCTSLQSFDRLYMIGSSHMRYAYDYYLFICRSIVKDVKVRLVFVNAGFAANASTTLHDIAKGYEQNKCKDDIPPFKSNILSADAMQLVMKEQLGLDSGHQVFTYHLKTNVRLLKNTTELVINETTMPSKIIIVNESQPFHFCRPSDRAKVGIMLQTGAWDLSGTNLHETLTTALPTLYTGLEHLARALRENHNVPDGGGRGNASHNVHFLAMGAPPFNPFQCVGGRSTPELMVVSRTLEEMTKKLGLHFFPLFGLLLQRYQDNNYSHYLTCGIKKGVCRGQSGMQVYREALLTLAAISEGEI